MCVVVGARSNDCGWRRKIAHQAARRDKRASADRSHKVDNLLRHQTGTTVGDGDAGD